MKIRHNNISYYHKYLISYIIILIIPILFIALYVNGSIFKTLEKEVIANDVNSLYQVKNNIESYHDNMQKIKQEIYLETCKKPFFFKDDPLRGLELIKQLKSYQVTNPFVEDVLLYFCGDKYIYNASGTCPIKIFADEIFHYENWDSQDIYTSINKIEKPIYRPAEKVSLPNDFVKEYVTMIYPLSVNSKKPYAIVAFVVPREVFDIRINDIVNNKEKITVIIDNEDNIIITSKMEHVLNDESLSKVIKLKSSQNEIKLDGKVYIKTYIQTKKTGWKYLTLTPKSCIYEKIRDVRLGFLIGILLIAILGLLFINLSMHINYNPIRKLKNYSENFIHNVKKTTGELELVREAIDYLSDMNEQLTNEVEYSNEANKQYITLQLLRGAKPYDKKLHEKADRYGVTLNNYFTVAIIYVSSKEQYATARGDIIEKVKEDFSDYGIIYTCEHIDCRKIIMILSLEKHDYLMIKEKFIKVQKSIKDVWNISTTIGISDCYNDKEFIPKLYIEASTAVDYRLVKGHGCVIFFSDIIEQEIALKSYPTENLKNITSLLKVGNIKAIEDEIDMIVSYIKENNSPIFIARGLCFDIINMIFQTGNNIITDFDNSNIDIPDVFTLSQCDTMDELINIIKDLTHDLCTKIIEQKDKEELSLIHEMVIYIKNNYVDLNFSLLGMADYFNMSQSSLSMYFKDKTGQTILNYITRMKIDKAKELLITTNITLNKLSKAVGYSNTTSFIRRFKQWEEITPGEYRKKFS
ncbi:AraC family transcriptional regulator [Vallitalea longa]|uniref:AraC family transcriptional regulator n=1 Tax=Vallitalea longa TaxID=2936439 RepID=A0A9W6DEA1_9FIRM|nr:helix-turn-helix domain-containing protein [Vallitalea longa]GKX28203.1 AraC family transcriptional regulator [Vallitalea longa]